jgi:hypothetical protein
MLNWEIFHFLFLIHVCRFWHSWHKNLVNTFLDFDGNQLLNDEDSDLDACNKKSLEEHLNKPKLL